MTVKLSLFNPDENNAFMLAAHMPVGRIWSSVFDGDKNLGKLVAGLAIEYYRLQVLAQKVSIEMDIRQADELLLEWEKSVGIPGGCFNNLGTTEQRRKQIEGIFSNFGGVQTADDFIRVAAFFGFTITVIPGSLVGTFPLTFPVLFFDSTRSATHTIFIQTTTVAGDSFFPLPFPIPFSSGGTTFLQCLFDLLAPANVQVLIVNENEI